MGFFQAMILEWLPFPPPGDLPNLGIELVSPVLQADYLQSETPEKLIYTLDIILNAFHLSYSFIASVL